MTLFALIASMVALASPTAHGPIDVRCAPIRGESLGMASPWNGYVTLAPEACRNVRRVIKHKAWAPSPDPFPGARRVSYPRSLDPIAIQNGLFVLLHEAGHMGQWHDGYITSERGCEVVRGCELDASCRALAGMSYALRRLGYSPAVRQHAVRLIRQRIADPRAIPRRYVGKCPR